jgi:hypothetical protein
MASTTFSGPVTSTNGFVGAVTGAVVASSPLTVGSTAISEAEIGVLDGVTAGTATASKALVLGASKEIATITSATITTLTSTSVVTAGLTLGATAVGSTATEIDNQCDVSLNTETIDASGVVSVTKRITKIVSTGAGAITIAAPSAETLGMVKVIEMTGGEHDITLALTNCQGQSSGTTATFSDINDTLVLVAGTNKWNVIGEAGIALS